MDAMISAAGIFSAIATSAIVLFMLFASSKERLLNPVTLFISIGFTLFMLPIFVFFSNARLNLVLALPLLIVGIILGLLWGFRTRLHKIQSWVVGKPSLVALAGWGGSWMLSQFLNLFDSSLLTTLGLVPLVFTTGTQVGRESNILLRLLLIKSASMPTSVALPSDLPDSRVDLPPIASLPEHGTPTPAARSRPLDLPK